MFRVFTDGACQTDSRRGGWAAIVVNEKGDRLAFQGSQENTTSQRMELQAAIEGLKRVPPGTVASVFSDSQYLIKGAEGKYRLKANLDLWDSLRAEAESRQVSWQWVDEEDSVSELREAHRLAEAQVGSPSLSGKVHMVDISPKPVTPREAIAQAVVGMSPDTLKRVLTGEVAKGDVLAAARIAGILAAKNTPHLIPLCHPLLIDQVEVGCRGEGENSIVITTRVWGSGKTGYEMEALVAAALSALTVYDMCKAYDPAMKIDLRLLRKSGGKSGTVEPGGDR